MEQHPFDEAAEGRRGALSRRELLAATGGVVLAGSLAGNAAGARREHRHAQARRHVPRRRHRRQRQGHHRRPVHRHQARPGAPVAGWETLLIYDRDYNLGTTGWPRRSRRQRDAVDDPAEGGHRVPRRQDGRRRRRHLLDQAASTPSALRRRRARLGRPEGHHQGGRAHRAMKLKQPDSTLPERSPSTSPASCRSATRARTSSSGVGTGPYIMQSFTPGPESVHERTRTTGARASRSSTRCRSSTSPTPAARQRAARGRRSTHHRRPVRPGARSSRATAT